MNDFAIMSFLCDNDVSKFIKLSLENDPVKIFPPKMQIQEIYDLYAKEQPQIVIVDTFLGEISFLDTIKNLRKLSETIQIIVLLRIQSKMLIERAFRFGANDILPYPCEREELRCTILHRCKNLQDQDMVHFNTQE